MQTDQLLISITEKALNHPHSIIYKELKVIIPPDILIQKVKIVINNLNPSLNQKDHQ